MVRGTRRAFDVSMGLWSLQHMDTQKGGYGCQGLGCHGCHTERTNQRECQTIQREIHTNIFQRYNHDMTIVEQHDMEYLIYLTVIWYYVERTDFVMGVLNGLCLYNILRD